MAQHNQDKVAWLGAIPSFWAMFTVGIASTIIGPSLPLFAQAYRLGWTEVGQLFTALLGGIVVAHLLLGVWEWRPHAYGVAAMGGILVSAGLFWTAAIPGWTATLAAVALIGVGYGTVDAGCTARFTDTYGNGLQGISHSARWLNLLFLWFSLGALVGPGTMTFLERSMPGTGPFQAIGIAALFIPISILAYRQFVTREGVSSASHTAPPRSWLGLSIGLAWVVCFFYGGLETALGDWIFTFVTDVAFLGGPEAALAVTLFWTLLALGRLLSVWGVVRMGALRWVSVLSVILCASLAGGLVGARYGSAAILMAAAGLGLSGIFPTIVAWVIGGMALPSARVVAWLFAGSSVGAMVVPKLVDMASDWKGVEAGFVLLFLFSIVVPALVFWLMRCERTQKVSV